MKRVPLRVTALAWFQNQVWAADYGNGLFVRDGSGWQRIDANVPRFITGLLADGQRLWYGLWMTGQVGYLDSDYRAHTIPLPRLVTPRFVYRVNCLTACGSSAWFGTQGYLLEYSINEGEWTRLLRLGEVLSLCGTGSSVWIGTDESLAVLDRNQQPSPAVKTVCQGMKVSAIASGRDGLYFGGYSAGGWRVQKYSIREGRITPLDKPLPGWVSAIIVDGETVFAGVGSGSKTQQAEEFSQGGVFSLDRQANRWTRLRSVRLTDVWCLLKVGKTLWVGGYAGIQEVHL